MSQLDALMEALMRLDIPFASTVNRAKNGEVLVKVIWSDMAVYFKPAPDGALVLVAKGAGAGGMSAGSIHDFLAAGFVKDEDGNGGT